MRLIRFDLGGGEDATDRIQVETLSPSMSCEGTDDDSNFAFELDFGSRFDPASSSELSQGSIVPAIYSQSHPSLHIIITYSTFGRGFSETRSSS